jgi:hypothetical protein
VQHERIGRVPMGAKDLAAVRCPEERSNLGGGLEGVETRTSGAIPYIDGSVIRAPTTGEEGGLPRAPGDGL